MGDDRNEADRILGEDWVDPRHVRLAEAVEAHPERGLIVRLQQETDEHGERRWSPCRQVEEDGPDRQVARVFTVATDKWKGVSSAG